MREEGEEPKGGQAAVTKQAVKGQTALVRLSWSPGFALKQLEGQRSFLNDVWLLCWVLQVFLLHYWVPPIHRDHWYHLHSEEFNSSSLQPFSLIYFHFNDLSVCSGCPLGDKQMFINAWPYWQTSVMVLFGTHKSVRMMRIVILQLVQMVWKGCCLVYCVA